MFTTVVGDYINTMETTFALNFDLNKGVKQLSCQENLSLQKNSHFLFSNFVSERSLLTIKT